MKIFIFIFSLLFFVNTVSALEYKLPKIETRDIEGQEYKCANVSQWQTIVIIASEYKSLYDWRLKNEMVVNNYQELTGLYGTAVNNKDVQITTLKEDREYLTLRLNQELNTSINNDKRLKIEKGFLWAIIAIETVIIGVIGIKGATN